jgi:hypothetical protein
LHCAPLLIILTALRTALISGIYKLAFSALRALLWGELCPNSRLFFIFHALSKIKSVCI